MTLPVLLDDPLRMTWLKKVLSTERANLISLWLQNEASGGVSYERINAYNGAYTAVTLGQSGVPWMRYTCPLFDGLTSFNNIYSAGLSDTFDGEEGTIIVPFKVSEAAVWEDETDRCLFDLYYDAENYIRCVKTSNDNELEWRYEANNTLEVKTKAAVSSIDWIFIGITWSKADDKVQPYYNGVAEGTVLTALGAWQGTTLSSTRTIIGALNTGPAWVWDGYISAVPLWTKALTATQMLKLSA